MHKDRTVRALSYFAAVAVLTAAWAGSVLAGSQGGPDIWVKVSGTDWLKEVTVESSAAGNVFQILLENTSDTQQVYHFAGPASSADWQVDYERSGSPSSNEFDLALDAGESDTLSLTVTEQGAPHTFFLGALAFGLGGDVSQAAANLVVPADLAVRADGQATWTGEDVIGSADDQVTLSTLRAGQPASFTVRLQNVQNASVSYDLRAHQSTADAQIVHCSLDGQDISADILSGTGYRTYTLYPGEDLLLSFALLPVGTSAGQRDVTVSARAAEIDSPALDITPIYANVRPFAVHKDDVVPEGESMIVYPGSQFSAGFFGLVNFDGGAFPTKEAEEWILSGFQEGVAIDPDTGYVWIQGGTGLRKGLDRAADQILGQEIAVPVYDQVTGQGHNTMLRVIGFIVGTLVESSLGEGGYIRIDVSGWLGDLSRSDAVAMSSQLATGGLRETGWRELH